MKGYLDIPRGAGRSWQCAALCAVLLSGVVTRAEVLIADDTLLSGAYVVVTKSQPWPAGSFAARGRQLNSSEHAGLADGILVTYDTLLYDRKAAERRLTVVKKTVPDAYVRWTGARILYQDRSCPVDKRALTAGTEWVLVRGGWTVASAGAQSDRGTRKRLTITWCGDGRTLVDSVQTPMATRIGLVLQLFTHDILCALFSYSGEGATSFVLKVYDLTGKRLAYETAWAHEGGPDTELTSLEDYFRNGTPTLVVRRADSDSLIRVLKWQNDTFK